MSDQLMMDLGSGALTEKQVFELLQNDLWDILDECAIPRDMLSYKRGKTFSSIYLNSSVMCHLCYRKELSYIEIPVTLFEQAPAEFQPTETIIQRGFVKFHAATINAVIQAKPVLCAILHVLIDKMPKEWDCCSRYLACSDAKKCIHPDPAFAVKCGYRRILKSGRIFYGKNRNI